MSATGALTPDIEAEADAEDAEETRTAYQCRRCKNWLLAPASIRRRLGPVCARHERAERRPGAATIPLFDLEVTT